jgi:hypothetical protein
VLQIHLAGCFGPDEGSRRLNLAIPLSMPAVGIDCFHDANSLVDMLRCLERESDVTSTFALRSTIGPAAALYTGVTAGADTTNQLTGFSGFVIGQGIAVRLSIPVGSAPAVSGRFGP